MSSLSGALGSVTPLQARNHLQLKQAEQSYRRRHTTFQRVRACQSLQLQQRSRVARSSPYSALGREPLQSRQYTGGLQPLRCTSGSPDAWQQPGQPVQQPPQTAHAGQRLRRLLKEVSGRDEAQFLWHLVQFAASLLFVVLYVWSTYSNPVAGSVRYNLDLMLCLLFACEWAARFLESDPKYWLRMVRSPANILDFLAFVPPLLEVLLISAKLPLQLSRFDLRWFKILRAMRVLRISLMAGQLQMLHLRSGALLSNLASLRLAQLIASVLALLFTTASIVQTVEKLPWHTALYFVITTLTTVGYGDVVVTSTVGRLAVVAMICVGILIIPVQTSQLYAQLSSRRVVLGAAPDKHQPMVLVSMRLSELRGFSDFFSEFFTALIESEVSQALRMVVLGSKPNFQFTAFQELHEKRLTLVEGSVLSEADLVTARAEAAKAVLIIADRFAQDKRQEDITLQFQVWAIKSYTKTPLYVQVLGKAAAQTIAPFLSPERDVVVSTEQTRHRMLALSCLCPGASTLIGNLLRTAQVSPAKARNKVAGGKRWLRSYINGCAFKVFDAAIGPSLAGHTFAEAAEWLYRTSGFVLIGIVGQEGGVQLNPARKVLQGREEVIVVATSAHDAEEALARSFRPAPVAASQQRAKQEQRDRFWVDESGHCFGAGEAAAVKPDSDSLDLDEDHLCSVSSSTSEDSDSEDASPPRTEQQLAAVAASPSATYTPGSKISTNNSHPNNLLQASTQPRSVLLSTMDPADSDAEEDTATESSDSFDEIGRVNGTRASHAPNGRPISTARTAHPPDGAGNGGAPRLAGHFVLCGAEDAFQPFLEQLRRSDATATPVAVLHPTLPAAWGAMTAELGPVTYVVGAPSEAAALRRAAASTARSLVFLAAPDRPPRSQREEVGGGESSGGAYREAVLADAEALLTCYGVGEESGAELLHAVVELCFTSSVRFLQPGLLLRGLWNMEEGGARGKVGEPRKSWANRKRQERAAVAEGLAEWQANPYYCAGRVTVPALINTFACQCFFNRWTADLMLEFSGDDGRPGAAMLRQMPLPPGMAGSTYGALFAKLALGRKLVPLGLYRRKTEVPGSRLMVVVTNPPPDTVLQDTDRVFLIRERGGAWLADANW